MNKGNCNRTVGGKPVPRAFPFFKGLTSCGERGGKALYKNAEGFYFQWDSLHGEWGKYSKTGRHLGALSPNGKIATKDAVKGRKITIYDRERIMNNQSQQDMIATEKTFVEMLQRGECSADDIDVYIDKWHDEYNGPLKLYEYLGMTKQQYDRWLVDSNTLLTMFPQDISSGKSLEVCVAK